ncbi:MAG: YicC family protein [Firmicutes bacterium]|nr:YicC family protein [Bacillota bacterium]
MIKSMTGFGRSEYSDGKRNVTAEIRSVNHRYCDITVKMPRRYSFAEEKLKALVKASAQRGKMELSINVENLTENDNVVQLNLMAARQYYDNLKLLKDEFGLKDEINLRMLASMPDVMKSVPDVEDEEELYKALAAAVQGAVDKLNEMRAVEGRKLAEDILMRGDLIRSKVQEIETRAPMVAQVYTEKLRSRIKDLLGDAAAGISEERILLEAAVFADKSNITEELVRLDSHILQLNSIISQSSQPDGKKLDFLVQEMNREANTIGSKANDLEITNAVLFLKSEIEKIREQVQNIE